MPIPDYQTLMLPLLKFLKDGKEHKLSEAVDELSDQYKLTEAEKTLLLPSGQQTYIRNRIGWARTYMKKAGLIDSIKRGYFRISELGKKVLSENPVRIDGKYLNRFPDFIAFRELHHKESTESGDEEQLLETPEEALEMAFQNLRNNLENELLQIVKTASPSFFEKLVVELLVSMGYGGNLQDAGQAIGHPGDGGIDGIIKEDKLGLDAIYIQAKRWEGNVGRPEIQKFAGGLQGHRARKGVFITTSDFTEEALDFVERIDSKIILINGKELTKLMVEHNVGVTTNQMYEIKRIDSDYFEED